MNNMIKSMPIEKIKVNLEDKVAIVFGASVGIGAATAKIMALSGAKVVLASRNEAKLQESVNDIKENGGEAAYVKTDVSSCEDVKNAIDFTVKTYGGLDIVINNAGINRAPHPIHEIPMKDYEDIINTNLNGVFYGMKYGIPELLKRGGGSIVNISSIGGLIAAPGISPYITSKHGVIGMSKSAAIDVANDNIRINVVCPGNTNTAIFNDWQKDEASREAMAKMSAIHRIAEPYEIGAAIAWLASDAASFITGAVLPVDGGYVAM